MHTSSVGGNNIEGVSTYLISRSSVGGVFEAPYQPLIHVLSQAIF